MSALDIYLVISGVLLAFVASLWSRKSWTDLAIKLAFVAAAFFGAVMIAKEVLA